MVFAKSDCSNVFCILPILLRHRTLLTMRAQHPISKKWYFFIDKCLPFRASISCACFQSFSDALWHIIVWKLRKAQITKNPDAITNYLDDFLFIALTWLACQGMIQVFLQVCKLIGCPISMEKTEWTTAIIVFLWLLLNRNARTISVPSDKCRKALQLLRTAIDQKKTMIWFIQQLTGTLNFINRAIVPGRAFTKGNV